METLRIHYLSALLVPLAYAVACGGSDNPPATGSGTGGGSSANGGSGTGTGGSATGTGGSATGTGGSLTGTGGRGFMIPMETIVPDPSCPDLTIQPPDGGVTLPDGGRAMIPPGLFGDGGPTTLKGCCDSTGICGVAFQNSLMFGGMTYDISICATPNDIPMGSGIDAGPTKSCTYVAP